jgi:mannan endo-1,4-beta-mannosidase
MEIFSGQQFDTKVKDKIVSRIDSSKWDLNWPDPALRRGPFSIRWTGRIQAPKTGRYRLITTSDDGIRVWVDGKLVIDHWKAHSTARDVQVVTLSEAPLAIRVEYWEAYIGNWAAQLAWQNENGGPEEIIPGSAFTLPDLSELK